MKVAYKNKNLKLVLDAVSFVTAAVIVFTFVMLYGFDEPMMSVRVLHYIQIAAFVVLTISKLLRFFDAYSKREYLRANWYELPALLFLLVITFGASTWLQVEEPGRTIMLALAVYLVFQVVAMACRSTVNLAATGANPTMSLIAIFVVLIVVGAGLLMLPRSYTCEDMSVVDALFTATSATCVTGLIVKDTGSDFSIMGQIVILTLIQLGGLGIVIFGAVIALLLGQALSVRESVAMQDLLNTQTLGRIGKMIGFIITGTIIVEAIGAAAMYGMWDEVPGAVGGRNEQIFCSVFHSISAFCNAGFSLFATSLKKYSQFWQVYAVLAVLIVLGGLGFGVLYNIMSVVWDHFKRWVKGIINPAGALTMATPVKMHLQTKIVLMISAILIVGGAGLLFIYERPDDFSDSHGIEQKQFDLPAAFFQSITARTAGFNTVDIDEMSTPGKFILVILMIIGGSPGSTAGGIKTVTLAVVVMIAWASLNKRTEVEMFRRSVPLIVVGRAVTVMLLYLMTLTVIIFLLAATESGQGFTMDQIIFEAASALGTVGLTTGITGALTSAGKVIIIAAMLIGRLGPLTLLAVLTFNLRPVGYNYPSEPLVVG